MRSVEPFVHHVEAAVDLAQHLRVRKRAVVEIEDAVLVAPVRHGIVAPVRRGIVAARDLEAGGAAVGEEAGDALLGAARGLVDAGGDEDDNDIRVLCARDEVRGAVHHPVAVVAHGLTFHAAHIRAGIGLGHRQSIHLLAAHRGHQVLLDLFPLAGHQDVLRPSEEMGQCHRAAAKLALDQRDIDMGQARAADALGEVRGVKAQIEALFLDVLRNLGGHLAAALEERLVRLDLGLDEAAHGGDDHLLFFGQSKMHESPLSLGQECGGLQVGGAAPPGAARGQVRVSGLVVPCAGAWRRGSTPAP